MHPAIISAFEACVPDVQLRETLLRQIREAYSAPARHYHNLQHLDHLAAGLESVRSSIADPELLMLAAAYHDIVYDTTRQDNEEASADRARSGLQPFLEPDRLQKLCDIIIATKLHERSDDADTNLFCDADLAILGAPPAAYDSYASQIRQEYAQYPDPLYNPGRAAVLRKLLGQDALFKTPGFSAQYEVAARQNIGRELSRLDS